LGFRPGYHFGFQARRPLGFAQIDTRSRHTACRGSPYLRAAYERLAAAA
jgi:hypothetical protein